MNINSLLKLPTESDIEALGLAHDKKASLIASLQLIDGLVFELDITSLNVAPVINRLGELALKAQL